MSKPTPPTKIIYQGNSFTQARYDMTPLQRNILYLLQSKVHPNDEDDKTYVLPVLEIAPELNVNPENLYKQLKKATNGMQDIKVHMYHNGAYKQVVPFFQFEYQLGQGLLLVCFAKLMKPYLTGSAMGNYTTYDKNNAIKLTSRYGKRMYEMFSMRKDLGQLIIPIWELKYRLSLYDPETKKEQYHISDFIEYVVDVAVGQVNERTDLSIKYELIKEGRKYTGIKFLIRTKSQMEEQIRAAGVVVSDEVPWLSERLRQKFGLSEAQVRAVFMLHEREEIFKIIHKIELAMTNNSVRNIGAYSVKCFGLDKMQCKIIY